MISVSLVAYIQVPLSQKIAVITCFLPRVLVLGAALIRLIWLYPATPHNFPEYRLWIPTIISQAQLFLSITTASIPYMVPFFKNLDGSLRTTYIATNRDQHANHDLGRSASSLWFRRNKRTKTVDLQNTSGSNSTHDKLAPQTWHCVPTPEPLTPLSQSVLSSSPFRKASVGGLNIYIPHRDPQRQQSVEWASPRTESSCALSPICTSSQTLLLQSFIPSRKAPSPPHKIHSPRPATTSSCYSSRVPTPVSGIPRAERYSLFPPVHPPHVSPRPNRTTISPSRVPPISSIQSKIVSGVANLPGWSNKYSPSISHIPPKFSTTKHLNVRPLIVPSEEEKSRPGSFQDLTSPMGAAINSWFSTKHTEQTMPLPIYMPSVRYDMTPGHMRSPVRTEIPRNDHCPSGECLSTTQGTEHQVCLHCVA